MRYGTSALGDYLKGIGKIPLIDADEERRLSKIIQKGKREKECEEKFGTSLSEEEIEKREKLVKEARNAFIEANLRLVVSVVKKNYFFVKGVEFSDLVAEGNFGLMKAVDKYKGEMGYKFSTYATGWIRQSIGRFIQDSGGTIRLPAHIHESLNRLNKVKGEFQRRYGRAPSSEELAKLTCFKLKKVKKLEAIVTDTISLSTPVNRNEEYGSSLENFIPDERIGHPLEGYFEEEDLKIIKGYMKYLSERERKIVSNRLGLRGEASKLESLGRVWGVSRERIRQLEKGALAKIEKRIRLDTSQNTLTEKFKVMWDLRRSRIRETKPKTETIPRHYMGFPSPLEYFENEFSGKEMTREKLLKEDKALYYALRGGGQLNKAIPKPPRQPRQYRGEYENPSDCFKKKFKKGTTRRELRIEDFPLYQALRIRKQLPRAIPKNRI